MFGAAAFALASQECEAGAFHGATETLFRDRGTANVQGDVEALCGSVWVYFYRLQCIHGVGHGLMAWTSYELLDALGFCDRLADDRDRQSSSSGSAMLQRNGPADKVRSLGRVRICDILS